MTDRKRNISGEFPPEGTPGSAERLLGIRHRLNLPPTRVRPWPRSKLPSIRTPQDWEEGRRAPSGAARTLLLVTEKNPQALTDVA